MSSFEVVQNLNSIFLRILLKYPKNLFNKILKFYWIQQFLLKTFSSWWSCFKILLCKVVNLDIGWFSWHVLSTVHVLPSLHTLHKIWNWEQWSFVTCIFGEYFGNRIIVVKSTFFGSALYYQILQGQSLTLKGYGVPECILHALTKLTLLSNTWDPYILRFSKSAVLAVTHYPLLSNEIIMLYVLGEIPDDIMREISCTTQGVSLVLVHYKRFIHG